MPYFISILAKQEPFPFDVDSAKRTMFSCNYDLDMEPSSRVDDAIGKMITNAGIAVDNVSLFYGPDAPIPTGDGPYTTISPTGGMHPHETHNGENYSRPTIQIITRAKKFSVARDKAFAIYSALHGQRGIEVVL